MNYSPSSYPAVFREATHTTETLLKDTDTVFCLHGRVVGLAGSKGRLRDISGTAEFTLEDPNVRVKVGDIVELTGRKVAEDMIVDEIIPLAIAKDGTCQWEEGAKLNNRRQNLSLRSKALFAIRTYFEIDKFIEVETPALVPAVGQDLHIELFESELKSAQGKGTYYLITSPEHHMKRLLVEGWDRIYQICRCFRNGECSQFHNPEFTMVEWYRAYEDYRAIMEDVESLVAYVASKVLGVTEIKYAGRTIDLSPPWKRLNMREAFSTLASLKVDSWDDEEGFIRRAKEISPSIRPIDTWEDIFYKLLIEKIEPAIAQMGPLFLMEFPPQLAALAKLNIGNGRYAERVEAYVGGLELANGFTELNDPVEQRQRFITEQRKRQRAGLAVNPVDEKLLLAMEQGMPPATGIALGVDRLLMLLTGSSDIGEVMAFPLEDA